MRRPDVARFDFEDEGLGTLPSGFVRQFRYEDRGTPAPVRIQGLACVVTPPHVSGATASLVGAFAPAAAPVATVTATEDLAVALVRVAVDGRRKARLVVVAFDAGTEVARHHDNTGASPFVEITIEPGRVFRTIVVRVEDLERGQQDSSAPAKIVLDSVECVTQRDRERFDRDRDRCGRESSDGTAQPVTFLGRHEYEVAITTEVAVRHSATEWETATLTERIGFVTAGPPGLNESPEPGLELEPYVVSLPPGGRGLTYREEPVHVVLSDSLRIFGPGGGTTEADHRLPVTVVIDSAFDANPAAHAGKGSRASAEWFVANRGSADPWLTVAELGLVRALSRSGTALRYQALSEASAGTCPPDDVWVEEQPSVAVDPFEPSGPGLWEPMASYVAIMRLAQSPVVDRGPFEAADISSFTAVSGTWSFDDGALVATSAATGAFGDADWDIYRIDVHGALGPAGELGIVVLADPANPSEGLRALIRRDPAGGGSLLVESATGVPIQDEAVADIGDASALVVEVFADAICCRCGDATVRVPVTLVERAGACCSPPTPGSRPSRCGESICTGGHSTPAGTKGSASMWAAAPASNGTTPAQPRSHSRRCEPDWAARWPRRWSRPLPPPTARPDSPTPRVRSPYRCVKTPNESTSRACRPRPTAGCARDTRADGLHRGDRARPRAQGHSSWPVRRRPRPARRAHRGGAAGAATSRTGSVWADPAGPRRSAPAGNPRGVPRPSRRP